MSARNNSHDDFFDIDLNRDENNEKLRDVIKHFRDTFHEMYTGGDMSFQNLELYYCKPMQDDILAFVKIWSEQNSCLWDFNTAIRKCFTYHVPQYEQSGIIDGREIKLYQDLVDWCSNGLPVRRAILRALRYAERVANGDIEFSIMNKKMSRDFSHGQQFLKILRFSVFYTTKSYVDKN